VVSSTKRSRDPDEYDGTITVLMDSFEGKRLNSPNDIVVKSDEIHLGLPTAVRVPLNVVRRHGSQGELPFNVYRIDGKNRQATVATGEYQRTERTGLSPTNRSCISARTCFAAPDPRV